MQCDNIEVYHDYVREMVMRYMVKPKGPTDGSTDVPQMPYEFHQLIVYKALRGHLLEVGTAGFGGNV